MSVIININGNVAALIVNTNRTGASITANGDEVWSAGPSYPPYLTFSSASSFTLLQMFEQVVWDGTLEYSTDAENWATWDGSIISSAASGGTHYLYMRGTGNTVITGAADQGWYIDGTDVSCDGDIRTLLDYADPENTTMAQSCFFALFKENDALVKGPDLPSMTLATGCYNSMFFGCTALTIAPDLLALVLVPSCYNNMYNGCTALANHPKISATTGANLACNTMFSGCTSLTELCELNVSEFSASMCSNMYKGCSLIKLSGTQTGEYQTPYRLPATGDGTSKTGAFSNMFMNTGGTFTGSPTISTTYYTSNTIVG